MTSNPYVGPRAFKYGETLYGRDQEVKDLVNLLIARRIVLLYSPSGAGKTSLIQAALIGELEKEGFRVLPVIRPGLKPPPDAPAGANRYLLSVLMSLQEGLPQEKLTPLSDLAQVPLAEFLKRNGREPEESGNEVVIFDQFEEILTLDPTDDDAKKEFFQQLGEVLQQKNRWALFAMREEYVAALDPYLRVIPTRLKTTIRLEMLGLEAARQAIQEPARMVGGEFTDAAASQLVKDLSIIYVPGKDGTPEPRAGLSVEPVQLQVVCQRLWKRYGEDDLKIDEDELRGLGDVNTALADYYAEQVAAVAQEGKASERHIREWVQSFLVTKSGFRGQVMRGPVQTEGLDNQAIHVLVKAHLVREDTRGTRTYYELAHDRLIEPIRDNNEAWFQANLSTLQLQAELWNRKGKPYGLLLTGREFIEAKQWAASHSDQMTDVERDFLRRSEDKSRRNRKLKRLGIGVVILGIIAIFSGFLAYSSEKVAVEKARLADQQARLAKAGQLASSAFSQLQMDPERSILLALEAVDEARPLEKETGIADQKVREGTKRVMRIAENALHRAMFTSRVKYIFHDNQPPEGTAHQDQVSHVFFSPDCKRFATVNLDKTVKVWDGPTGKFLHPPDKVEVNWASFNQDGSQLALACCDGTVKIWDVDKKQIISLNDEKVLRVYFNKQGTYLATLRSDDRANLWKADDFEAAEPLKTIQLDDLNNLAFSPDGKLVATTGWDGYVKLWQVPSDNGPPFNNRPRIIKHGKSLKRVYFSPNGTLLATISSDDGMVKVWKISSGQKLWEGKDFVLAAAFSPDDKLLALANRNNHVLYVLNTATGNYQAILPGHTGTVSKLLFLPQGKSPNVRFLVSASEDETVKLWDIFSNQELFSLAGHHKPVMGIAVYPDPENKGNRLVSVGRDGQARVWDIGIGHTSFVNKVVFDKNGAWLATASNDGTARIWDTKTGNELACLGGDQERIEAMALSHNPNKEELVTAGKGETLKFWTLGEKKPRLFDCNKILSKIEPNENPKIVKINDITFSPHGTYAAVQAVVGFRYRYGSKILLFNCGGDSSEPPRLIPPNDKIRDPGFRCLAISPDENQMAIGLSNGRIQVWNLKNHSEPIEFVAHQDAILSVAYSPTADYLASAGADMKVKLWKWNANTNSWEEDKKEGKKDNFSAFDSKVTSVVFSHNGKLLAAGSKDRTAKVFNLQGQELHSFSHPAGINDVAFSPDDKELATACDNNRWYIHPLNLKAAEAEALTKVTRKKLTEEECRMFGIPRASTSESGSNPVTP